MNIFEQIFMKKDLSNMEVNDGIKRIVKSMLKF